LEVTADLLSEDAIKINPGDTILVAGTGEDRELKAVVTLVEPSAFTKTSALGVEEQRVNVVGRFVDNPGRLGDRYRVEVRIVLWQGLDVLKIPTSALFRQGEHWQVYAVDGSRARIRRIRIGHRGGDEAEIVEGLADSTLVVRHPSDRLQDNSRIKPRRP
jgi:HlyD family secretion protein